MAELALARGDASAAFEAIRSDVDPVLGGWRWAVLGRALAGRGVLDSALVVTAEFSRSEGFGWEDESHPK